MSVYDRLSTSGNTLLHGKGERTLLLNFLFCWMCALFMICVSEPNLACIMSIQIDNNN